MKIVQRVLFILVTLVLIHCFVGSLFNMNNMLYMKGMNYTREANHSRKLLAPFARNLLDFDKLNGAANGPAKSSLPASLRTAPSSGLCIRFPVTRVQMDQFRDSLDASLSVD